MRRVFLATLALLAGCGAAEDHGARTPEGWTTLHDDASGLSVRFPSDWHRASDSLTPDLTDPRELLSLGSFAAPPAERGRCAHMPVAAMRAAGPADVFVTIQERTGPVSAEFTPRSRPFAVGRADDSEAIDCVGEPRPWRSHWISFADQGRPLYALVLVGNDAPAERREQLQKVLDGIVFDRSSRFSAGRGLSGRDPEGWRFVHRRLAAAVSDDDQIAAATFAVPAGPPDGNCTQRAALDRMAPDDAFVYAFRYSEGVDLDEFPPRPERFALDPATLQPYECMGTSYLLRWRAHGQAFQAHVYLGEGAGAARRDEALEFLDDLVIEE